MRQKLIIVEGGIGAGKTDYCRRLGAALTEVGGKPAQVFYEAATSAEEGGGNPYLADSCADPKRYAYSMQIHALQERFNTYMAAQAYAMRGLGPAVVDRSFYGDVAFLELHARRGNIEPRQYNTYYSLYDLLLTFVRPPSVCIRLVVSVATQLQRIERRAGAVEERRCEQGSVTAEYLEELETEIDLACNQAGLRGIPVLLEHWNQDRLTAERDEALLDIARHILKIPGAGCPRELHDRRLG